METWKVGGGAATVVVVGGTVVVVDAVVDVVVDVVVEVVTGIGSGAVSTTGAPASAVPGLSVCDGATVVAAETGTGGGPSPAAATATTPPDPTAREVATTIPATTRIGPPARVLSPYMSTPRSVGSRGERRRPTRPASAAESGTAASYRRRVPLDGAAAIAVAGHRKLTGAEVRELRDRVAGDPDPAVRSAAVAAVARAGSRPDAAAAWHVAAVDPSAAVRRRAAELAPSLGAVVREAPLLGLLADADPWVAEAAAFALGERAATPESVAALAAAATDHRDALVREAAVAALGALGDPAGLPAVLRACDDRPAVRRRAVLALAAFEGGDVEARIRAALDDRDWQVRQAAEDLLRE
jgi:hypothetical protein